MNPEWRSRYEAAQEAARQASRVALRYFDGEFAVEWKKDQTPVTVADRETEQAVRTALHTAFPSDGFLGEEYGDQSGTSGFRWIIDPIDGTRNFVRGIPVWATLVGLEYQGEQIAGVVEAPAMGLSYRALRGDGAYRGERRIHVSDIDDLQKAQFFTSSPSWFWKIGAMDNFLDLVQRTNRHRGFGDFYGFMLVAQGSGEFMMEYGVNVWDVAALKPIIEEAGGRTSDWTGKPNIHRRDVLASNGKVHDAVLQALFDPVTNPRQPGVERPFGD